MISRAAFGLVTCLFAGLVAGGPAFAATADDPTIANNTPIVVYTGDLSSTAAGGAADQLRQYARQVGRFRAIVGLRFPMLTEDGLSSSAAMAQARGLVKMQDAVVARVLGSTAADSVERFTFIPFISLYVTPADLDRLLADPAVASVERDLVFKPEAISPNIAQIHADKVWAKGPGGSGYAVAIVDTGVSKTHPMLAGKVVSEACYGTNDPSRGSHSDCPGRVSAATGPGTGVNCAVSLDGCEHGTFVASIAAGHAATLDGVARGASIIAIKIASVTNTMALFSNNDQLRGLQRVYALRNTFKIAAVNLSSGIPGAATNTVCDSSYPALALAFKNLRNAGIAPIKSSGNDSSDAGVSPPGCISTLIVVGNATKDDLVAPSSDHASLVKLLAPGTDIKGAVPPGKPCPGTPYCYGTGTSYAAPHVAGAFALLKSAKPTATLADILGALACSGKVIHQRANGTGTPPEVSPPRPRIDLLGAYNYLKRVSQTLRSWSFTTAADVLDWTPVRGTWRLMAGGGYAQTPVVTGWVSTALPSCDRALKVTAVMRRVDPSPTSIHNSGIFLKSTVQYSGSRTVSGYFFAYNKCHTEVSTGACHGTVTDPRGQALVFRAQNYSLAAGSGIFTRLCMKQVPINYQGDNTLTVINTGTTYTYYLNKRLVCSFDDATYATGADMVTAFMGTESGHSFLLKSFAVTSYFASPTTAPAGEILDVSALAPQLPLDGVTIAGGPGR